MHTSCSINFMLHPAPEQECSKNIKFYLSACSKKKDRT
jgi:hypothetical protein